MTEPHTVRGWIAERLPMLLDEYDVPAASVAVMADGEVVDAAVGC
jgi:sulfur carrier protein ThiS